MWGSIGQATPAAFGITIADPGQRTAFDHRRRFPSADRKRHRRHGRFGANAIVFVLNNDGYLIERSWEENPIGLTTISRPWKYAELLKALGCADSFYRARGHARRTRRSHEGSPREQIRHRNHRRQNGYAAGARFRAWPAESDVMATRRNDC